MRRDGIELLWPGKYDASGERAAIPSPGRRIEPLASYGPEPAQGTLVGGDNLAVMDALLRRGEPGIDLVVIDPPFATGEKFSVVTPIGVGGEVVRAPAYSDRWQGGVAGFLAMLDPRLRLIHRLLAAHGSLYVHLDPTVAHPVKVLLDEIFGPECFQREIIWRIGWVSGFKSRARNWIRNHDTILFYVKDPQRFTFNKRYIPYPPGYLRRDGKPPKGAGIPLDDVWNAGPGDLELRGGDSLDSIQIKSFSREKTGWATQKNESLLRRIIEASSNAGDRVADFFCGSGSTLAAAASLSRRWIGCDEASMAIHLARKRLREAGASFVLAGLRPGGVAASAGEGDSDAGAGEAPAEAGLRSGGVAASAGEGASDAGAGEAPVEAAPRRDRAEAVNGGLEFRGDEAWLRVEPGRTIRLEELRRIESEVVLRGCPRLRVVARRWGFSLAELAAAPRAEVETRCLHWRGAEPALPRPELELSVQSVDPWTLSVELRDYRHSDASVLPDPALADRVGDWSEWLDAWALAIVGRAGRSTAMFEGACAGPEAPCPGLFRPHVEHFRTRRSRELCCVADPFILAEEARGPRVELRLQVVDIVGLETVWPCLLDFDATGELTRVQVGPELAGELLS